MTYREAYKMVKAASLDKKALIGPLAFLRKHPQIIKGVYDMPGARLDKVKQLLDIFKMSRGKKTPLIKLFKTLSQEPFSNPPMGKGQSVIARVKTTNPDRRLRDRFWAALGTNMDNGANLLRTRAQSLRRAKSQLRNTAKNMNLGLSVAPKYGTYDVTDSVASPQISGVLRGKYNIL